MVDKTQPESQRRYRTKLNEERNRVPELEARVKELEAELAALRTGREAVSDEVVARYHGPDRILFLDMSHGEAVIDGRAYYFAISHGFGQSVDYFIKPLESVARCRSSRIRPRLIELLSEEVKRRGHQKLKQLTQETMRMSRIMTALTEFSSWTGII